MSLPAAASASGRSSPAPEPCPECDATGSVTSDLHKYQVACTCKPSAQYARAVEPGAPPAKADCPPALPPRPPPSLLQARRNNASPAAAAESQCRRRKYAWWCVGCGALAAALGGLLAAQHILLRAYTASPQHLETVPAAVPAAMLVLTGVCIMSLARRRNRYSYMIKVVGVCCLLCALTCVLVTITTTVIHMNKLQALKFCEYTAVARTCTCYSLPPHAQHTGDDEGVRCVFEGVSECAVVHGALHWCLRGVFALSVAAVLVCICSCMLAYQLLSHERKKMYWEQLELRCRSLYRPRAATRQPPPARPAQGGCNCCAACRPAATAWDVSLQHRFWAPGRIGNLYSPNPGTGRKYSAWSWFPWPRSNSQNSRCRMNGVPQSGDSAYGFCETDTPQPTPQTPYEDRAYPSNYPQPFPRNNTFPQNAQFNAPAQFNQTPGFNAPGQFPAQGFPGQGFQPQNFAQSSGSFAQPTAFTQPPFEEGFGEASGSFDAATGVWGPPPPYSPQGRMGSRHHLHHTDPATATLLHHHHIDHRTSIIHDQNSIQPHTCRNSYMMQNMPGELARELTRLNPELIRLNPEIIRVNPDLGRLNPDVRSDLARMDPDVMTHMYSQEELSRIQEMGPMDGRFHTLRGHLVPYRCQRNIGMSAGNLHRDCRMEDGMAMECVHQKSASKVSNQSSDSGQKHGKENLAFQSDKNSGVRASMQDGHRGAVAAESEVYFADVSSCCNMSVKADCCVNPNVSALVGTIESHPESTSESDTGSFTLTRQQRPQPQTCSKRRPRQPEKHMSLKHQEKQYQEATNSSLMRLTEQQIEQLNNSMRLRERQDERIEARKHMVDMEPAWEESRMNESRLSDCRKKRPNDSLNESQRLNESKLTDRSNDSRVDSRADIPRMDRMNETRLSERERMEDRRMSDSNSSIRIHGSPKMRLKMSPIRMKTSPKTFEHPRQPSNDSNKGDFFTPISPLSPKTEESLLSDDDGREDVRYSNEPETSKCIAPDSQYEAARENKEEPLKTNHHHCYSDTNTMDSGWQSGSEKQVTD